MSDTPDQTDQPELDVRASEAKNEDASFTWAGQTFTFSRNTGEWPLASSYYFQLDMAPRAIAEILGDAQFERLLATGPRNKDFDKIYESMNAALGTKPGESEASSD